MDTIGLYLKYEKDPLSLSDHESQCLQEIMIPIKEEPGGSEFESVPGKDPLDISESSAGPIVPDLPAPVVKQEAFTVKEEFESLPPCTDSQIECRSITQLAGDLTGLRDFSKFGKPRFPLCFFRGKLPHDKAVSCDTKVDSSDEYGSLLQDHGKNKHEHFHVGNTPEDCKLCGKLYTEAIIIDNFLGVHFYEKKYFCNQCGQCFSIKSDFTLHEFIERHSCKKCKKCFFRFKSFKKHKCTHSKVARLRKLRKFKKAAPES